MAVIDISSGIKRRSMASREAHNHDDHRRQKDSHIDHAPDPHIWLSPVLVRLLAENVRDALIKLAPEHSALFHQRFADLAYKINETDNEILARLAEIPPEQRVFLVFHPAYGYFADAYGFKQIAIESEGKEPGPRELSRIIEQVRAHNISTVFVQPQFPQGAAEVIAREINGSVETLDPLAEDWAAGMIEISKKIHQATIR